MFFAVIGVGLVYASFHRQIKSCYRSHRRRRWLQRKDLEAARHAKTPMVPTPVETKDNDADKPTSFVAEITRIPVQLETQEKDAKGSASVAEPTNTPSEFETKEQDSKGPTPIQGKI